MELRELMLITQDGAIYALHRTHPVATRTSAPCGKATAYISYLSALPTVRHAGPHTFRVLLYPLLAFSLHKQCMNGWAGTLFGMVRHTQEHSEFCGMWDSDADGLLIR